MREWVKGLLPRSSIPADYTVQRIRELAEGTCVKNYEYNGRADAREKTRNGAWSLQPILIYFCTCSVPTWNTRNGCCIWTPALIQGLSQAGIRYSWGFCLQKKDSQRSVPSTLHPGALVLAVDKLCPPTFALYWDKKVQFTLQGRTALWDSILLMCHKIKGVWRCCSWMNLGSSALNILQVVDSETDD
ncbi:hypothetical protein HID58_069184 [Brassica napus]|uniref:Uncharacterized protein n=1 Tax=Brassica napus TaxID=3708 RepID=A0ABQ7XH03_BRANA|nr:hypothetical protein HID58_069184 [Brassica napus]